MTRLIDADKLHPDCFTKDGKLAISQSQIADAPTVSNGTYEQGFRVGAYGRLDEIRPKGNWKVPNSILKGNYYCDNCNEFVINKSNFCPNCGAKMEGGMG